ncbi:plasmid pRiA4b ORF-3 family protein, partial [Micromonospora sp. KC213]
AALADPTHPEHAVLSAWVGSRFDPDAFDPGRVSTLLRRFC